MIGMDHEPLPPDPDPVDPDPVGDDPEVAALLDFVPVPRRQHRDQGWSAENQRIFIGELAETGDPGLAAAAVGLTANGAYQLRRDPNGRDFLRAWQEATALYRARNGAVRSPPAPAPQSRHAGRRNGAKPPPAETPELEAAERQELLNEILQRYVRKIHAERTARLAGRFIEADFYVRQLTHIELILDIGGRTQDVLTSLGDFESEILVLTATPGSVMLEKARRLIWQEKGEADRPPPAPLGRHDGHCAMGEPTDYNAARDGDFKEWERRQAEKQRLAAEVQEAWEERLRQESGEDRPDKPAKGESGA